jgi:anti-anti-sigma factor
MRRADRAFPQFGRGIAIRLRRLGPGTPSKVSSVRSSGPPFHLGCGNTVPRRGPEHAFGYTKVCAMSVEIQDTIREGIVVLSLKGRLTVGESNSIRDKINECAAAARVNVILDLTDVDYVDSTGLGTMVICFTSLKKQGGALKLVNPNKRNVELLLLTKLHTVFQVFTEVQDAVNSFFPGREIKRFDILQFVKEHAGEETETGD